GHTPSKARCAGDAERRDEERTWVLQRCEGRKTKTRLVVPSGAKPRYRPHAGGPNSLKRRASRNRSRSSRLNRKPPRLPSFAAGITPLRAQHRPVRASRQEQVRTT